MMKAFALLLLALSGRATQASDMEVTGDTITINHASPPKDGTLIHNGFRLAIVGPGGFDLNVLTLPAGFVSFDVTSLPMWQAFLSQGASPDGHYKWQLSSIMSGSTREEDADSEEKGVPNGPTTDPMAMSGSFLVVNSKVVDPNDPNAKEDPEAGRRLAELEAQMQEQQDTTASSVRGTAAQMNTRLPSREPRHAGDRLDLRNYNRMLDQVFNDDIIITFSLCVGNDCVNGESFGFDTLRLKENNLRIRFQDTSTSASFPSRDWQLVANDSSNGGLNHFSIEDIDGGRVPFRIEAGAPSNSLYVDDAGRIGLGTSTPVVEMHIADGDTPTMRLEQDGSSGFTPQTWDVAGNESNFFVRDVTNGSKLSFRIQPGTRDSALTLRANNRVGFGSNAPSTALHIYGTQLMKMRLQMQGNGDQIWDVGMLDDKTMGQDFVIQDVKNNMTPLKIEHGTIDVASNDGAILIKRNGDVDMSGSIGITGDLVVDGYCRCKNAGVFSEWTSVDGLTPLRRLKESARLEFDSDTLELSLSDGEDTLSVSLASLQVMDVNKGTSAPSKSKAGSEDAEGWNKFVKNMNKEVSTDDGPVLYAKEVVFKTPYPNTNYGISLTPMGMPTVKVGFDTKTTKGFRMLVTEADFPYFEGVDWTVTPHSNN